MKIIVYGLGVFIVTTILYVIPILITCSFIYEWNGFIKLLLIMTSIIEFGGLSVLIADKVSRGE